MIREEEKLIEEVKASGKLIGVFRNPFRDCVYEEAAEVVRLGKDTKENVEEKMQMYRDMDWPAHAGLAACGVIVRHHIPDLMMLNTAWWAEVCSGSKRDQLSFPVVFIDKIHYFEGDIYQYKKWNR